MVMKLDPVGIVFSVVFIVVSGYFMIFSGWEGVFVPIVLTLPFSIVVDSIFSSAREVSGISYSTTNGVAIVVVLILGVVEYYCIGKFLRCISRNGSKNGKNG